MQWIWSINDRFRKTEYEYWPNGNMCPCNRLIHDNQKSIILVLDKKFAIFFFGFVKYSHFCYVKRVFLMTIMMNDSSKFVLYHASMDRSEKNCTATGAKIMYKGWVPPYDYVQVYVFVSPPFLQTW